MDVEKINEMKYPCDECVYKATEKGNLRMHVKLIHERVRYTCDQCDYEATEKVYLSKHRSR